MTANAIAYAKYLEDQRHNYVQERLEAKKRQLEQFQAEIADRKQRADAIYQRGNLQETVRHNTETEQMTKVFNDASVYLKYLQHKEDVRHNAEMESVYSEGNQIGWLNADIAQQNTDINKAHQEEYVRSNKEYERLTERGQDVQAETNLKVANIHKDATITSANIHANATKYVADMNYASTVYASNTNYSLGTYVANNEYVMNRERLTSQEKIATRDRIAQTNRTRITANATRYTADQNYKGKVYGSNATYYSSIYGSDTSRRNTNTKVMGDIAGTSLTVMGKLIGGFGQ